GYLVIVHFNKSKDEAKKLLGQIQVDSPGSSIISADLTSEDAVGLMFKTISEEYKSVDLLVNNVGNFLFKPFAKTTNGEFRDLLETNIYSTLYCSREALNMMRKQKSGHIINIGAVGAERLIIRENSMPYFLGKTGVYVLTKTMAWEEAKNGVHINMISPASLKTDIFDPSDFPMGREAKYEDVIKALSFLTSEAAYYINGANIEVSGGFVPGMDKVE
ncbi:MAG: SDR family oxidoreductase, partial [Candidatus Magasanikbacteria bacterium]|nr:SDR family oxidoreductase [Candidatus Magasanikbacteria bacterium]